MVKKDRKHRNEKTEGKAMVVTKKDIMKHRFFDLLNGNPFCILLISSLLAENTAWQVFQKIERSQNQTGPRTVCAANNFQTVQSSIKSTHFIQIQCINNKNPRLMKALKLLVFCPGGLCDSDLKTVVPMWDKWSDLLKDWNLVKVKSAEEVYTVSGIKDDENEDDYGNGSDMQYIYMIEESLSNYIEKEMDGQECDLFEKKATNAILK